MINQGGLTLATVFLPGETGISMRGVAGTLSVHTRMVTTVKLTPVRSLVPSLAICRHKPLCKVCTPEPLGLRDDP